MSILERLDDEHGSVVLGWLGELVLYARFERTISTELGRQFVRRFTTLFGDAVEVRYFSDYSAVRAYDVGAFPIIFDALLARRDQLAQVTLRPWETPPRPKAYALLASIGCVEYAESAADFEARLRAAAPATNLGHVATLVRSSRQAPDDALGRGERRPPAPAASAPAGYTYVFDFDDFEAGRFTATRATHLSTRPHGAWVCVAGSDEQALALARQAALHEWATPKSRRAEDFTVRFVDARPAFDRRR